MQWLRHAGGLSSQSTGMCLRVRRGQCNKPCHMCHVTIPSKWVNPIDTMHMVFVCHARYLSFIPCPTIHYNPKRLKYRGEVARCCSLQMLFSIITRGTPFILSFNYVIFYCWPCYTVNYMYGLRDNKMILPRLAYNTAMQFIFEL